MNANNQLKTFNYESNAITFEMGNGVMVNATEMARQFGKRPVDWLNLPSTKEFLNELSEVRKSNNAEIQLVLTKRGGADLSAQGTWLHEDVALEFARWLSPKFAIWCNDRIKELLTQGHTEFDSADKMLLVSKALIYVKEELDQRNKQLQEAEETIGEQRVEIQAAHGQIEEQQKRLEHIEPMAQYTREVLQSTSTFTLTQVAKDLGFVSIHKFTDWARERGILYRQSGQWIPNSKHCGNGYFATRTTKFVKSDNTIGTNIYTVVTERGRAWLHQLLAA